MHLLNGESLWKGSVVGYVHMLRMRTDRGGAEGVQKLSAVADRCKADYAIADTVAATISWGSAPAAFTSLTSPSPQAF